MQNKFWVTTLAIIISVLSLFYLSFTFVASNVEKKAREASMDANGVVNYSKLQDYTDSIWNKPVYNLGVAEYTYKEVKDNALNLGLDLQGGMHVTLEVSPADILKAMAGTNPPASFQKALERTAEKQKSSQDRYINLFFESLQEGEEKVTLAEIFATASNKGIIDFNNTEDEIKEAITKEVDDAIERAQKIIETRIDQFGVTQPNIQRIQGTGRIQIELPGVDNPKRVRKLISGVAQLEFLEVAEGSAFYPTINKIDEFLLKEEKALRGEVETDTANNDATVDTLGNAVDTPLFEGDTTKKDPSDTTNTKVPEESKASGFSKLIQGIQPTLTFKPQDTSKVNAYLNRADIQKLMPINMRFMWGVKPFTGTDNNEYIYLYAVEMGRGGKADISGDVITNASESFDELGRPEVVMQMNAEGARAWRKMTRENVNQQIAVVLDNRVYSAPNVNGEIPNGRSSISGSFSVEEAKDLANILKAGKLPAPTRIVEEAVVGPSLGLEAQQDGIVSILCGLAIVVLFMIAYYSKGGVIANIALLFNLFFIVGILSNLGAALTLPGIAGMVLTIGMSIDANVLIFERIREEMKLQKNMARAIQEGYDKAFWTIFDANVTTMLTGIFLFVFGSGPIKGFATTLMIGIACSFFTAVYITRVIVSWMTKDGKKDNVTFETAISKNVLKNINIDFLGKRKMAYITSAIIIIIGWSIIAFQGLNLGVDLKGGRSYQVKFSKVVVASDVKSALSSSFEGAGTEVKTFGNDKTLKITTSYLVDNEEASGDEKVLSSLISGLETFTGDKFSADDKAEASEGEFTIPYSAKVGATIADDIKDASTSAVLFSLAAIFLYILVRFRNWRFGLGAIAALFHDTLMVFAIFGIVGALGFSFEIDQVFVAAMLTVIGYSINDTVVVFDRVREYLNIGGRDLTQTFNESINSTLSRTVITSLTTLLVILVLFLFGGEVLRGFSFALLVGIIFGTYSSVFVATPIVYDTSKIAEENKAKKEAEAKRVNA